MNFFNGFATHQFAGALGVLDVQPEQHFHNEMEAAADEAAEGGLFLEEYAIGEPARTDHAIGFLEVGDQLEKSVGAGSTIRVNVADVIGVDGELETFNQRAAL